MLFVSILQSLIILGYEVDDIISENENWHRDIRQGYALAIKLINFDTSFGCFAI